VADALAQRANPGSFLGEALTVARYSLIVQQRYRSWIFNTSLTPFFLLAPLVFVANSFLGQPGPARQAFVQLTGYDNYLGFLIVPLIDATMTSTVYSNIGHTIRFEQMSGTLERLLMSLRYPVSLILGRSLGFLAFVLRFAGTALGLCWLFFGLRLDVSPAWTAPIRRRVGQRGPKQARSPGGLVTVSGCVASSRRKA
jgi:hypothetical protein